MNPSTKNKLIQSAQEARLKSYSPYSKYKVGAALLSSDGQIFLGCNVENASYGESICAERTAVVKAVSEGQKKFKAIAVATSNGGAPCGSCRQVLGEFNADILIFVVDEKNMVKEYSLSQLLPHHFGPSALGK